MDHWNDTDSTSGEAQFLAHYGVAAWRRISMRVGPMVAMLILLAFPAWGQSLNHDAPSDALVDGVLNIKVSEGAKSAISLSNEGAVAQMGIASIDALSAQFDAQRIERIFPTDQRYADRHAKWGLDRWYRVYLQDESESLTRGAVGAFHADANVEMAEHVLQKRQVGTRVERTDRVRSLIEGIEQGQLDVTNDPLYETQWHFNNTGQTGGTPDADIDLPEAHDIQMGGSEVIVQVVDSGIEIDHPDMQGSYWVNPNEEEDGTDTDGNGYVDDIYGYNFADDTPNPEIVDPSVERNSHGLHVSGTVAARNNNNEGVASVAGGDGTADSGVRIMTANTFGNITAGFAPAIVYGADNGAVISNNSWSYGVPGAFEEVVLDAIDYFVAEAGGPDAPMNGGLVVVAAGNDNRDAEWYPGFYEPTLAVSATDHNDGKSSFSNFGDWVDIAAPSGEGFDHPVISTIHTSKGTYGGDIWAGTSMAAPHVAGVAALIASEFPGQTAQQVRTRLIGTADETDTPQEIGPRLNAFEALTADSTPPAAITDLSVTSSTSAVGATVDLQWTATGSSGSEGTATTYDLRFSTEGPIETDADFNAATPVQGLPDPQEAGSTETFTADGLPFDSEVYLAIKAIDELGGASDVSNSPSTTTGPGPEISIAPESIEATVARGTTEERTLTVSNDGEGALEYSVFAASDGEAEPRTVASSFTGQLVQGDRSQIAAEQGDDAALNTAEEFQASDFFYQLDDGSSEEAIGSGGGGDVLWLNAFQATEGATTVTSIASAWGFAGASSSAPPAGSEATFLLYDDPNNDGDPSDAILLESVDTVVEDPGTDQFTDTRVAPTRVEGVFFIAAVYRDHPDGVFPASLDLSSESQQASWIALSGANQLDEENLPSNGLFGNIDALGLPGNWLLRANGTNNIVAFSPEEGVVEPGESQDVTVTINAEELPPREYAGNIRFTNNDPENNPLDVPYDIAIDAGPPEIVLEPRTLEFEDQLVGGTGTQTFEITNLGSDTLAVSSIGSSSDDFTALTTSVPELAFEETAEVEVEFTPTEAGVRVGTIAIESNAENKPTAEVAVVGEGLPAPSIAADPESFDVTVPFGEGNTLEETLLVSNAGEGELEYDIEIVGGAAALSPAAVAAPFTGERAAPSSSLASSLEAERTSSRPDAVPTPQQADEFVYQLDDGSSESQLGAGGGDFMWINAFETVGEATTINAIGSAWADVSEEREAEFFLYNDPNNDGNPQDAVLLESVETSIQAPGTDEFTTEEIAETDVEGVFFIAAVVRGYTGEEFPAPLDQSSGSQQASWAAFGEVVDETDLSGAGLIDNLGEDGFPGNWLLRADGFTEIEGEPGVRPLPADAVTLEPNEGTVAPGGQQELAITFNGNIEPGPYTGSIRILNNDPLQSSLDVPVDLLVDDGPPEIALDPESLTFDGLLVGNSSTLTFEISNAGGNPLIIDSVTSDSEDFIIADDLTFDVRQDTVEVSVEFAPTAVGTRSGSITLQTNLPDNETVSLAVEGEGLVPPVLALNPDVLQNVQEADTVVTDIPLTISNNGDSGSTLDYSFPVFAAEQAINQAGTERNNTSRIEGSRDFGKGEPDPMAGDGHPVLLGAGGPDDFGHLWIDSNEEGGPSFQWTDITENEDAVELEISDDFGPAPSVEVELPFDFRHYGETRTSVRVDNNGFLFFEGPVGNYFTNQQMPTEGGPDGVIAPLWTDLDFFSSDSEASVHVLDDSENGRFIVQYTNAPPFFGEGTYTFQVILSKGLSNRLDDRIRFQYLDTDVDTPLGSTVGIEDGTGTDGLQVAFNTEYIEDNLAVDIVSPIGFITAVDPVSGSLAAGESETVDVTFDSEELEPSVYESQLGVSTNDPRATFGYAPAVLSVVGPNGPEIDNAIEDQQLTLGGAPFEVDLSPVFTDPIGDGLEYSIEASNPALVDTALEDNTLTVTPTGGGASTVSVTATNADGEARAAFNVTIGQLAVNVNRDFGGDAVGTSNYRLVALPGAISLPVNEVVDGEAGVDWQVYWDSGADELVEFDGSETFTFEPGRGFWLTGQSAWEYQSEHSAIELERPDGQVTIPLHEGWNIISNPMGINRDLEDLEVLNGESLNPFWTFNGSFSADSTLASAMSGEAYYFLNDGGIDELILQPGEEQPEPPSTTASAASNTDPLLSMSATPVNRREVTSTVQLGITESGATLKPLIGPPSEFEAVSLRIQPAEEAVAAASAQRSSLMRAQRTLNGDGEIFTLTLRSQVEGPVEISFGDLMALNGHEAALLHPEAGTTYDLRESDVVTIEPTSDEVTLRMAIGTQAFVDGAVDDVLPTELTLTAYPNPVQSQATVQYTLTEPDDVRFEVYDMLGRRVATLANGRKQAGVHELPFDASGLASGVYFGRLQVGGQTLTQKITVVR